MKTPGNLIKRAYHFSGRHRKKIFLISLSLTLLTFMALHLYINYKIKDIEHDSPEFYLKGHGYLSYYWGPYIKFTDTVYESRSGDYARVEFGMIEIQLRSFFDFFRKKIIIKKFHIKDGSIRTKHMASEAFETEESNWEVKLVDAKISNLKFNLIPSINFVIDEFNYHHKAQRWDLRACWENAVLQANGSSDKQGEFELQAPSTATLWSNIAQVFNLPFNQQDFRDTRLKILGKFSGTEKSALTLDTDNSHLTINLQQQDERGKINIHGRVLDVNDFVPQAQFNLPLKKLELDKDADLQIKFRVEELHHRNKIIIAPNSTLNFKNSTCMPEWLVESFRAWLIDPTTISQNICESER